MLQRVKLNVHHYYTFRGIFLISKFLGPNTQFILKMESSVSDGLKKNNRLDIRMQQQTVWQDALVWDVPDGDTVLSDGKMGLD